VYTLKRTQYKKNCHNIKLNNKVKIINKDDLLYIQGCFARTFSIFCDIKNVVKIKVDMTVDVKIDGNEQCNEQLTSS